MLFAALGVTTLGAAQPLAPRASLVVTRGEGAQDCPDANALADQVHNVAGSELLSAGVPSHPVETWVQVAIGHDFGGYTATIISSGTRHGTRTLQDLGPSCASLADAIAVTVAIFLDPYANAPAPPAVPTVPATRNAIPKAPPQLAPLPAARYFLDSAGGVGFAMLEHAEPLVSVGFGLRVTPRWSLSLGGTFVFPDTVSNGSGNVDLGLSYALVQGCGQALGDADSASLAFCAVPMLGLLRGSGHGYPNELTQRAAWFALGVGPRVSLPLTRAFAWVISGQGVVPLVEHAFDVRNNGVRSEAFHTSAVGALISLGIRGDL